MQSDIPSEFDKLHNRLVDRCLNIRTEIENKFRSLADRLKGVLDWENSVYRKKVRYRQQEDVYAPIKDFLFELTDLIEPFYNLLGKFLSMIEKTHDEDLEQLYEDASGEKDEIEHQLDLIGDFLEAENEDYVYWITLPKKSDSRNVKLKSAPLDIDELFHSLFLKEMNSAIFTSATMTVADDFDYFQQRLGFNLLEDPSRLETILLGSSFDFQEQLKVLIPRHIKSPKDSEFSKEVISILDEVRKLRKGTMLLSTSYSQLKDIYYLVKSAYEKEGTLVLAQGQSGSRTAITRRFKEVKDSILIGTESFWQGIDIPGEALQILMVLKLPFPVPSEPYVDAQCERLRKAGSNPFYNYFIPEAVIRFRQGIGRLIRNEDDKGILFIMDKRVATKDYGASFLRSLPLRPVYVDDISQSIDEIASHFGENQDQ